MAAMGVARLRRREYPETPAWTASRVGMGEHVKTGEPEEPGLELILETTIGAFAEGSDKSSPKA